MVTAKKSVGNLVIFYLQDFCCCSWLLLSYFCQGGGILVSVPEKPDNSEVSVSSYQDDVFGLSVLLLSIKALPVVQ